MDLWPYINGKAITLGLNLGEMDVTQMLDVLHFFFEEDSRYSTAEEAEAVSKLRSTVYGVLYGTTYKYASTSSPGTSSSSMDVKPYIPPTEFDPDSFQPFGSVLDSPLG